MPKLSVGITSDNKETRTVETVFHVDQQDVDIFPELTRFDKVILFEDENGFVFCNTKERAINLFKNNETCLHMAT